MILISEEEKIREIELRTAAVIIIQSFWRKIRTQRQWIKMKRGFIILQKIFRKRLHNQETDLSRQLKESEKEFETVLQAVKEKRRKQEIIFDSIRNTPSYKLNNLFDLYKEPRPGFNASISKTFLESGEDIKNLEDDTKNEAAKVIQLAVRKWLSKRLYENLAKSQPFLNMPITEERAIKLQQDIDHWQYQNKVLPLAPNELTELHNKAQMKYAKFCQGLVQSRKTEQKSRAIIAQSKALIEIIENRPDIHAYESSKDYNRFHSLPLHIATKARLEHNLAMSKLEKPSWKRVLLID